MLPILKAEGPKIEAIKNNTSLSGMQKMEQLRAIHNESAPQLQKILSPAQYQKLQAIRQQEIKEAIAKKRAGAVVRRKRQFATYSLAVARRNVRSRVRSPACQIELRDPLEYQYGFRGGGDNYKYWLEARVGYCF